MRIGILGGSFDPVHRGHTAVALAALAGARLDRVWLLVAASPPHKAGGCLAPFAERVAMVRLAIRGHTQLAVSDREGAREGPSYTFYTLEQLSRERPGDQFVLLVGADMLLDLPHWHRARELVAAFDVIAFARPGFDFEGARTAFQAAFGPARLASIQVPALGLCSSRVREIVAADGSIEGLVAPEVAAHIHARGLYRPAQGG